MSGCKRCGGRMTVVDSCFPGFDLLQCGSCGRPLRLLPRGVKQPAFTQPKRGDLKRALRASRRMKQRSQP